MNRCTRGTGCYAAETTEQDGPDGKKLKVGAMCDRPLCDVCTTAVERALDETPALYVRVRLKTLDHDITGPGEQVTTSRGSPMPLHGQALHLGEDLRDLLARAEDDVRRVARLTPRISEGRREAVRIAAACRFLAVRITAWITVDVQQPIDLLEWRNTARRLPGLDATASKAVRRYEHRCPACGVRAITHRAGDDLMTCQSCGATQPYLPTLPREADYGDGSQAASPLTMAPRPRGPESDAAGQDARSGRAAHTWDEGGSAA